MKGHRGSGKGWSVGSTKRDGQFVMKYRATSGEWCQHRVPKEYQSRREAERYAAAFYDEIMKAPQPPASVEVVLPPDRGPTLGEFYERWVALRTSRFERKSIRRATLRQDISHWRNHIDPKLGNVPIPDIDPPLLRDFVRGLRAKLANYTVRNVASTLKQMLDDIDAEGWYALPRNPVRHKKVVEELPKPRTRAGKKVIVHLTKEMAEVMLKSPEVAPQRKLRHLVTMTTGMRMGELFGLRFDKLRLDDAVPVAQLREALALQGFDGPVTMQELKTEDSSRDLPLQPLVASALRWWRESGWLQWVGRKPTDTDFVFANEFGKPYRPKAAQDLRTDLGRAGCPTTYEGHNLTAHGLRRSFSTLLNRVPNAHFVKDGLMGHSPKSPDAAHYAYVSPEQKLMAVEGIVLNVSLADITNGAASSEDPAPVVPEAAE